jgi:hypothetical protein
VIEGVFTAAILSPLTIADPAIGPFAGAIESSRNGCYRRHVFDQQVNRLAAEEVLRTWLKL